MLSIWFPIRKHLNRAQALGGENLLIARVSTTPERFSGGVAGEEGEREKYGKDLQLLEEESQTEIL